MPLPELIVRQLNQEMWGLGKKTKTRKRQRSKQVKKRSTSSKVRSQNRIDTRGRGGEKKQLGKKTEVQWQRIHTQHLGGGGWKIRSSVSVTQQV